MKKVVFTLFVMLACAVSFQVRAFAIELEDFSDNKKLYIKDV